MNIDKTILKIQENKKIIKILQSVGAYPYNIPKIGPTGKFGPIGPTARFNKSSNRLFISSSKILLYKKYH